MSDYIPFEIQSEIIKILPVKSIVQFRSVSKQWKAFIDNPEFIKNYHNNHTKPQHHLLVRYELDDAVKTYTSIVDNNTFPQQKFRLTAPESLCSLRNTFILDSVNGLLCFCCRYGGFNTSIMTVVIWNPAIRKFVDIDIPLAKAADVFGFGVCPDTSDLKLVNIGVALNMWEVEVFTLSTRIWKPVYKGAPFKSCYFLSGQVFLDGVIYFCAYDYARRSRFNIVILFDLKSEKFGEACLPKRLVPAPDLYVTKVNESLGLLEYYDEGEMSVCGVWSRKDGVDKPFTKIYTVKVKGKWLCDWVLGFRNNSEVVMELDDDNNIESTIGVCEPLSGHINNVGIYGKRGTLYASSYMETLLLLDEPHSLIH